jgi:hypothetical protein
MADLQVRDGELVLALSTAEKLEGLHGDLHAPLAAVSGLELLEDAHAAASIRAGVKLGTRLPGVIEVATIKGRKRRLFAAVHHDTPRGLRISLEGLSYDEWVVGLADPEGKLAELRQQLPAI